MEHLPDRDASPLHAGYWGDQGMIWGVHRKHSNLRADVSSPVIVKYKFLSFQTPLPVCVQVIMIECADLKNVINYQEVEALKHTIKVNRERDE